MTRGVPRGECVTIAFAGRCNAGKSSLVNAFVGQDVAIVSEISGTTTDPVVKRYELPGLGPVALYDTAGLDDPGTLGQARVEATHKVLSRADVVLLVVDTVGLQHSEWKAVEVLRLMDIPFLVVFSKQDLQAVGSHDVAACHAHDMRHVCVSSVTGMGLKKLKEAVAGVCMQRETSRSVLVSDLLDAGDTVLCVTPIDTAAPKGRLILPQVQVLRDILDAGAMGMVTRETELHSALNTCRTPPTLVVTDSQAVLEVARMVPDSIPLTTFSILFARYKGDLGTLVRGARHIDTLQDGDKVLVCEACAHHAVDDDIGRVKIPRLLRCHTGKDLVFSVYSGHDFPQDLETYALVLHCGACMSGRTEMLRRIHICQHSGVPITNYGVAISKMQGLLKRVIAPLGVAAS